MIKVTDHIGVNKIEDLNYPMHCKLVGDEFKSIK